MPQTWYARDCFPSHLQVLALLMQCVSISDPQSGPRAELEARFCDVKDAGTLDRAEAKLCSVGLSTLWVKGTMSLRWIV